MADNDIVQRIIIQAVDDASGAINNVAKSTQSAFQNLTSTIRGWSQAFNQGWNSAAQGSGQAAQGLQQVAEKSAITRRELSELGRIATELGAGPLGGLAATVGRVGIGFGALAAGAVAVGFAAKTLFDFAKSAADTADGLERLSAVTGTSFTDLSALQQAFATGGVSAKQFNEEFLNLALHIQEQSGAIAQEFEASADKIAKAQLKVKESFLAVQNAQLQGQQLGVQLQSVQLQLQYLPQLQKIESQRADIAVRDAAARVRILALQQQLRDGTISQDEYEERIAQEQEWAFKREMEKAKIELESARLQQQMLPQQLAIQARMLELQEQSIQLQIEANALARQKAPLEVNAAQRDLLKEQANDLRTVLDLTRQLAAGVSDIKFDPLTTQDTKLKAIYKVLDDIRLAGGGAKDQIETLSNILARLPAGDAYNIGKKLGLTPQTIELLRQGGDNIEQLSADAVAAGRTLSESDREGLGRLRQGLRDLDAQTEETGQKFGAQFADQIVAQLSKVNNALKILYDGFAKGPDTTTAIGSIKAFSDALDALFPETLNAKRLTFSQWLDEVVPKIDAAAAATNRFLAALGRTASQGISSGADLGGVPGGVPFASGGLVRGPGSATSDSIWARLSAGEFVMRAAAVQHFGASLFAALNNFQAPGFAFGGMVSPRLSPAMGFAGGGLVGGGRTLHLTIGAETFRGLVAPEDVAVKLERFAVHSQIASTGRKPSWQR